MNKYILFLFCLSALHYQAMSQCPRQLNFVRQLQQDVIETPRNFVQHQPTLIAESPCNCQVALNPTVPSSTTIITDCSPTACKNLANTLQLMIVCNLLQNSKGGSELALQLAAPMINELFTSPTLSCGCSNPFAAGSPNFVTPNVVSPNIISGLTNTVSGTAPFLTYATSGLLSGF
ncbi:uncharacterized protein LOC106130830 [Amyelois transitella]|uniref:uncharacterized protein LOC106130830 n=1 Tax=Amyelois transitella TaxID=680683 RepID=UPI00298F7CC0|nr:uncharacterized protein LOC106130830 [Amyelois transitella]